MLNVILVCQMGASTGMIAESIKKAAAGRNMEAVVNAYGLSELNKVIDSADIVLLGPQVRFNLTKLQKQYADKHVPISVIDTMDYGMMNGENILNAILGILKNEEEDYEYKR